jgi:hypothetical protein
MMMSWTYWCSSLEVCMTVIDRKDSKEGAFKLES